MAGWKEYAHEIRKRSTDYPAATVQHVAIYAKDNNRVYIIDENGALVDFQVADIFCYNIDVSETAEVGETLSVSGNGYFWSDLHVEDNTYIGGIVDVSGNGYFWSDVIIDGNLLVNSNVAIGENLEVSGNSYFYGDVVMGDDLEVAGDTSISGSLYIAGKLTVDGLIDPTGLQLTPISANPGNSHTIWSNSENSNNFYIGNEIISTNSKNGFTNNANNGGGTFISSNKTESLQFIIRVDSTSNGNLTLNSSIYEDSNLREQWVGHTYTTLISGDFIQGNADFGFMKPVGSDDSSVADTVYVKLSFRKTNSSDIEYSETISYYTPTPNNWTPQIGWFTTGNTSITVQYISKK